MGSLLSLTAACKGQQDQKDQEGQEDQEDQKDHEYKEGEKDQKYPEDQGGREDPDYMNENGLSPNEEGLSREAQKPFLYNRLLPYNSRINDEAAELFAEIRSNLARSVALHQVNPVTGCWASNLDSFLSLYGYHFSKKHHVELVEFLLELIVIKGLDLVIVGKVAHTISLLLKERDLLSRADLSIEWRPLYLLYERLLCSRERELNMLRPPPGLPAQLEQLVASCRPFFPPTSTLEMLDEWEPLLCPFDQSMQKAMNYFQLFLPTTLLPEHHDTGFRLWFPNFIGLWQNIHNTPEWEASLVRLFSRLAEDTIGYIEWDPYIPTLFTRLLRSFNLPERSSDVSENRHGSCYTNAAAVSWVAALLGGGSSCQEHLTQFLRVTKSYWNPSYRRDLANLRNFLYKLTEGVVRRRRREQCEPSSWETPVPDSHRMSEEEVTVFVESMRPVLLLSISVDRGSTDSVLALQNLAFLKPELVIPPLLQSLYSSLEAPSEPNDLNATIACVAAVGRNLVRGGPSFPEGPAHVVRILTSCLREIDSDDFEKTTLTLHMVRTFVQLIPLVDCSEAVVQRTDLSGEEKEVCLTTAGFRNFVLDLIDRCFSLIEKTSASDFTPPGVDKWPTTGKTLESYLKSTLSAVFQQCSPEIFKAALEKLDSFASHLAAEASRSGRYVANICRCMVEVNPDMVLSTFVPHLAKLVTSIAGSMTENTDEKTEDRLHYLLLLLSEIVACDGKVLQRYMPSLRKVLRHTLALPSVPMHQLSCNLLKNLLRACSKIFPSEYRSTSLTWDKCLDFANNLPTREWGQRAQLQQIGIRWHVPTAQELSCVQDLLQAFLRPQLRELFLWSCGEHDLSSDQVQRCLAIARACVQGAATVLPMWPEEPVDLLGTTVAANFQSKVFLGTKTVSFKSGVSVRQVVASITRQVLEHTMKARGDDVGTIRMIIKVYDDLMFFWGVPADVLEATEKEVLNSRKWLGNWLCNPEEDTRALMIQRAHIQQEMREVRQSKGHFTNTHRYIMQDVFRLGVGTPMEVRMDALELLYKFLDNFPGSHNLLIDGLVELLSPLPESRGNNELSAALSIILGDKHRTLLLVRDWSFLGRLWPALVGAQHSEVPAIVQIQEDIIEVLLRHHETLQIKLEVPPSLKERAQHLELNAVADMQGPIQYNDDCNSAQSEYGSLVGKLVCEVQSGYLDSLHCHMALVMLQLLIRSDVMLPSPAVHTLVHHLVNGASRTRKVAVRAMGMVLRQLKPHHAKKELDLQTQSSLQLSPTLRTLVERAGGRKPANLWLQYNSSLHFCRKEQWEMHPFVHATHVGFYRLPRPFLVYAPEEEQPSLDRTIEDMNASERAIFQAFSSGTFVHRLSSHMSSDERSDKDRFNFDTFFMFKGLFRNYGSAFLPHFEKVLRYKISSNEAGNQRYALEILTGLMRGSKHWGFEKMLKLRTTLEPILRLGLPKILPETLADWGTCVAGISEHRDPNKYQWFFQLLLEEPNGTEAVADRFLQASHLRLRLAAIAQQQWRVCEILEDELERLKQGLANDHPDVREKISGLLRRIFMYDVHLPMFEDALSLVPRASRFMEYLLPLLAPLTVDDNQAPKEDLRTPIREGLGSGEGHAPPSRKAAANVLKTVCRWILATIAYSPITDFSEFFKLVPVLCHVQSYDTDAEVQRECAITLDSLGDALLPLDAIPQVLGTIIQVMGSPVWQARASSCNLLRSLVDANLFLVSGSSKWRNLVVQHTLALLKDDHLEVRESAAETLTHLFLGGLLEVTDELVALFRDQCLSKANGGSADVPGPQEPGELVERHAGILGLCACINAYPLDLPAFLRDVMAMLEERPEDPPFISLHDT